MTKGKKALGIGVIIAGVGAAVGGAIALVRGKNKSNITIEEADNENIENDEDFDVETIEGEVVESSEE